MDAKQLRHLMPKNAEDVDAARELVAVDPEVLAPVIPEMLRHLKHVQSPVSATFCEFFANHGERYAGHVISMLGRDTMPEVKHLLLACVLPAWSREAVAECAGALTMIATNPSALNADLLAIRLLARHRLADAEWLRQWLEFKFTRLKERSQLADEVAAEMEGTVH
jgi:hypothetical protein